jgi:hypothetical protein
VWEKKEKKKEKKKKDEKKKREKRKKRGEKKTQEKKTREANVLVRLSMTDKPRRTHGLFCFLEVPTYLRNSRYINHGLHIPYI